MEGKIDQLASAFANYNNYAEENGYYVNISHNDIEYVSGGKAVHVCNFSDIRSVIIPFNEDELIIVTKKKCLILTKKGPKT